MKKESGWLLVLLSLMLLTACNRSTSVESIPTPTPPVTVTPPPRSVTSTATRLPTSSSTLIRTATFEPTLTPKLTATRYAGEPLQIIFLNMYDAQNGWGVDDQGTVLKTRDGGSTWIDTAPGMRTSTQYNSFASVDIDHARFLESYDMQVARCQQEKNDTEAFFACFHSWVTWRTVDGGKTWSPIKTQLPEGEEPHPESLFFANRSFGWSVVYLVTGAMGHGGSKVFISSDGGTTWVASTIGYSEIEETCVATTGRLWFSGAQTGWAGKSCNPYHIGKGGRPWFAVSEETSIDDFIQRHFLVIDRSTDAGLTWKQQLIAAPNDLLDEMIRQKSKGFIDHNIGRLTGYGAHSVGFFVTFGTSTATLRNPMGNEFPDQLFHYFYISFNQGQTYRIIPASRELIEHGGFYFSSPLAGWQWTNTNGSISIERTLDGGLKWEPMGQYLRWQGSLQFVDESHGWAMTNTDSFYDNNGTRKPSISTALLHSEDGGTTWIPLEPTLADR